VVTYADKSLRAVLSEKLQKTMNDELAALSSGAAKDWADYRERVGRIRGLQMAVEAMQDAAAAL